jgi:spore maturation protein CgeB
MYRTLLESQITINVHIDVAEKYANNMRLYEATGCGALLITDQKDNLGDLFRIGSEVIAYGNAAEAVELIKHYSKNAGARAKIAQAGQERTLKDHTYRTRMRELETIISKYYGGPQR